MPKTLDPLASDKEDWDAVQSLIVEVEQAHRNVAWNAAIVLFWVVAVRAFRIVERKQLFELAPNDGDLKTHETLLGSLIKLGHTLETRLENIDDEDLAEFDVRRANLSACVRELEDTMSMWHGSGLDPFKAAELEKAIFGGAA